MKVVRSSPLRTGRLYPQEYPAVTKPIYLQNRAKFDFKKLIWNRHTFVSKKTSLYRHNKGRRLCVSRMIQLWREKSWSDLLHRVTNTKVKTNLFLSRPGRHIEGAELYLHLDTGWRWVVNFTPRLLGATRRRYGRQGGKSLFPIGIQSPHRPTRSLVTVPARIHLVPDFTSKHRIEVFNLFLQQTPLPICYYSL
jgi:hypothetical protein